MAVPQYIGRNRAPAHGGPSGVQRSYASELRETEALFNSYEHLQGLPRSDVALTMLRKVASLVKPIMRKRGWRVQILAEFLPAEQNLLGLNINKGYKICIRLRYHNNPDLFLAIEEVVDTMLHELSHNIWCEHDSRFHALWDELRDEHETLVRKGYTGEGFLSAGHKLGGGRYRMPPPQEMRRLARASAEKRRSQNKLTKGSGQRLGGTPLHAYGGDVRQVIADSALRRNKISKGCGSGRQDAIKIADDNSNRTFKTKAEEDDANDRAIAQALFELMEQEEERKIRNETFSASSKNGGLEWRPATGLYDPGNGQKPPISRSHTPSEEEQMRWAMQESSKPHAPHPEQSSATRSPVSPLTPEVEEGGSIDSTISDALQKHHPNGYTGSPVAQESAVSRPVPNQQEIPTARPTTNREGTLVSPTIFDISEPFNPDEWTCEVCTCINPTQFLACDACGCEKPQGAKTIKSHRNTSATTTTSAQRPAQPSTKRPRWTMPQAAQPTSLGWNCVRCGAFMEHKWWTCSACGLMKSES